VPSVRCVYEASHPAIGCAKHVITCTIWRVLRAPLVTVNLARERSLRSTKIVYFARRTIWKR